MADLYNFDTVHERRNTDSQKWQKYEGRDVLPMWVADMDFQGPPEVLDALHERVHEGIFGYARPTRRTIDAVLEMLAREHQWEVDPGWMVWLPGLGVALHLISRAFAGPGNAIVTATPVYPPFLQAPQMAGSILQAVPLARAGDRYEWDWEAMEAAVTPLTKLFLLCHPHNPVGRVYQEEEINAVADFCLRHNLILCSDEVHCDLLFDDRRHQALVPLRPEMARHTITLMAPSKTYNLAGLACAFAIIPDPELRLRFQRQASGVMAEVNNLGYAACEAAYRQGGPWLRSLLCYLQGNRDFLLDFVHERLPLLKTNRIEATYLAWIDARATGWENPADKFEEAGVGLSDGRFFGHPGFVRLNFACPRATLQEGLRRIAGALSSIRDP